MLATWGHSGCNSYRSLSARSSILRAKSIDSIQPIAGIYLDMSLVVIPFLVGQMRKIIREKGVIEGKVNKSDYVILIYTHNEINGNLPVPSNIHVKDSKISLYLHKY